MASEKESSAEPIEKLGALQEEQESCTRQSGDEGVPEQVEKDLKIEKNAPAGHVLESSEDRIMNRRINLKMDIAMLPLLSLLYLFSGLDRGNIGNAETQSTYHPLNCLRKNKQLIPTTLKTSQQTLEYRLRILILQYLFSSLHLLCFSLRQRLWEGGWDKSIGSR